MKYLRAALAVQQVMQCNFVVCLQADSRGALEVPDKLCSTANKCLVMVKMLLEYVKASDRASDYS